MSGRSRDPEDYTWMVLPGRRVSHAILGRNSDCVGLCGHTARYTEKQLAPASKEQRCEQCLITIVSNIHAMTYKFFVAHVPAEVRTARRKAWREYRESKKEQD
jgi:hypothetical protein